MRRLLAVLGADVSGSLSPFLHTRAATVLGLDVAYVPVSCPDAEAFHGALEALRALGALGANVTNPHKIAALEACARCTEVATAIGAVNTLTYEVDGLVGDNTDGPGLLDVLRRIPESADASALVLGAGGASRAVVWALARRGVASIAVAARDLEAARRVGAPFGAVATELNARVGTGLVVSTIPGEPDLAARALDEWIDVESRPFILDLAYFGRDSLSPLTERARASGLHAIDGRHLLVAQAARALAGWTGGELSCIREVMEAALGLEEDLASQL